MLRLTTAWFHQFTYLILLTLTLSLWSSATVFARDDFTHIYNQFTVSDGLGDNEISSLAQDQHGYLWIGTKNGISRFDGKSFRPFSLQAGLGVIGHQEIRRLYFDETHRRLWVATNTGLALIDTQTLDTASLWSYERFKLDWVDHLVAVDNDKLMLVTSQGVHVYSLERNTLITIPQRKVGQYAIVDTIKTPTDRVFALTRNKVIELVVDDNIWRLKDTLFLDEADDFQRFTFAKNFLWVVGNTTLQSLSVSDLARSQIIRLDDESAMKGSIIDATTVSNASLEITTDSGIYNYSFENNKMTQHLLDSDAFLFNTALHGPKKLCWLGTKSSGLVQITGVNRKLAIKPYTQILPVEDVNGLVIYRTFLDSKKRLWYVNNAELFYLDESGKAHLFSQLDKSYPKIRDAKYIFEDSLGRFWIFTGAATFLLNEAENKVTRIDKVIPEVEHAREDKDNNSLRLWSTNAGYYRLGMESPHALASAEIVFTLGEAAADDTLVFDGVNLDSGQTVLATDKGLVILGFDDELEERLHTNASTRDKTIRNDWVSSVIFDGTWIWFGTYDGLYALDPQSLAIVRRFHPGRDYQAGLVTGLMIDKNNNVVVSTSEGLAFYWRDSDRWQKIHHGHGLVGLSFFRSTYSSAHSDTLFLPTRNGILRARNLADRDFDGSMKMTISRFYLGKADQEQFDVSPKAIQINHSEPVFFIEFKMIDYIEPETLQYEYRLDGHDEEWYQVNNNIDHVRYSKLPPGLYTFKVRAKKNGSVIENSLVSQKIMVRQAPWATPSAFISYALLAFLLIWAFTIPIRRQKKQERKAQAAIQASEARMKLALKASDQRLYDWSIAENKIQHFGDHKAISFIDFYLAQSNKLEQGEISQEQYKDLKLLLERHLQLEVDYFQASFSVDIKGKKHLMVEKGQVTELDNLAIAQRMSGVVKDVTQKHHEESRFNLVASAFDNANDGVCMVNMGEPRIEAVNNAFTKITGWEAMDLVGQNLDVILQVENDRMALATYLNEAIHGTLEDIPIKARHRSGQLLNIDLKVEFIADDANKMSHFLVRMRDVTDRIRVRERYEQLAERDELTGLPNRIMFLDMLSTRCKIAKKHQRKHALMYCMIHQFEQYDELFSGSAVDALVKRVGETLRTEVGKEDVVAYLDGPSFSVLISHYNNNRELQTLAQKIQQSLSEPLYIVGQQVSVTLKVGIACFPQDATNHFKLMVNAKLALENASAENGHVAFFHEHSSSHLSSRFVVEKQLIEAAEQQDFEAFYQPKVDMRSGDVNGAEMLVRWRKAKNQILMPDEFLSIAQDNGIIRLIDEFMLSQACQTLRKWHGERRQYGTLSVNLSLQSFLDGQRLMIVIEDLMTRFHVPARSLEIELTEDILNYDHAYTKGIVDFLDSIGVCIAIDDFGRSLTSFQLLKTLPINSIKLDASFTRDITEGGQDQSVVRAIAGIAEAMQLIVCAKGVESEEQLAILKEYGIDCYQGYQYSAAVPLSDFELYLKSGVGN